MRVYGRTYSEYGNPSWQVVTTDVNGLNDYVYLTALVQEIKLNLGESPFWGNRGIPAQPSIVTQIAPDYYVLIMQQRYAPYFLSIAIVRVPDGVDSRGNPAPYYRISVVTHYGVAIESQVPL